MFNNQVWLIHIYREFISAINKEIDVQCNAAKSQGAKLDAGNLTKVMDEFNKQLNEARDLCKRCEPDSFMKMGIFKITDVKTNVDLTDADISKLKIVDHYNSPHCKDCRFCRLTKEFPNPDTARPGDPEHYYQSSEPACIGCEHWHEMTRFMRG